MLSLWTNNVPGHRDERVRSSTLLLGTCYTVFTFTCRNPRSLSLKASDSQLLSFLVTNCPSPGHSLAIKKATAFEEWTSVIVSIIKIVSPQSGRSLSHHSGGFSHWKVRQDPWWRGVPCAGQANDQCLCETTAEKKNYTDFSMQSTKPQSNLNPTALLSVSPRSCQPSALEGAKPYK